MKNFFKSFLLIVMVSVFFLSGCNLVQINTTRYYEKIVASVNGFNITKKELLNAYNNYGYQYVNSYGYTTEEAIEKTLEYLVNRKLLAEYVATELDNQLTITQKNAVWNSVFDSVNAQLLTLENTIRKELNMEEVSDAEDAEDESDYPAEEKYEKKIIRTEDGYEKVVEEETEETELITKSNFVQNLYGDSSVSSSAWNRYVKLLLKSEEGKNLDTIEQNVFYRELDRLYKLYEEDKYISLFETTYEESYPVDVDAVVAKYRELAMASYAKYTELGDEAGYTQYVSDMQSDNSTVYWHPYGEKFTAVAHILLKFSEEQLATLADIKDRFAKGYIGTQAEYDYEVEQWKASLTVKARDENGNETGEELSVADVYNEINSTLSALGTDVKAKAEAFNSLIYKYGQDTGMFNATKYYVVNLDTDVTDTMVTAFAEESRRLYNEEGDGSLSQPIYVDNTGSSNAYAGYHIIFNVGGINNVMVESIGNLQNITADELYDTRIMLGTEKTYFDAMYDLVYSSSYSNRQTSLLNQLKADAEIIYYLNNYKDLY